MTDVIAIALPFFSLILIGYLCGRAMGIEEAGMRWMNFFIVYVALPPLFFKLVSEAPLQELLNPRFVMATTAATLCVYLLAYFVGRRIGPDRRSAVIQGVLGAYSNIGYMGPGLTLATLGPAAATPTALVFVCDNLLIFALTPMLISLADGQEQGKTQIAKDIARRVLTHPFNIATALGVIAAATGFRPPHAIDQVLVSLKGSAAPVALFALGVTVALRPVGTVPKEFSVHLPVKLLLHPLLVWLFIGLVANVPPLWTYTAMLMAALPPALNVFVLARQYDAYVERASTAILVGTLLSMLTLTTLMYLIVHGMIPPDPF
jgi:malonate transporter and related proteins